MGYLDKSTITVDAILTNRGRELLAQGGGATNFRITKFAIADDEVDYRLYDVNHPLGSNYYGAVIENMPVLEATPDETLTMRYKLVTITDNEIEKFGTVVIPEISVIGAKQGETISLTYSPNAGVGELALSPTTTYTTENGGASKETSYTLVLGDSTLATVNVTQGETLGKVTSNARNSVIAKGTQFLVKALNKKGTTAVTIYGDQTGAVISFTLSTTASS